jgi:hypothetical protein
LSIPGGKEGKFYFECYPHPSIIGMMKRDMILKYKCRHKNSNDWDALRRFLSELPIRNIATILKNLAGQTKGNEDKLDSIVCAWTAYLWWKNGKQGSLMAGSMETGYIVTPVTDQMRTSLQKQFGEEINNGEGVTPSIPEPRVTETAMVGNSPRIPHSDDARRTSHPAENAAAPSFRTTAGDWSDIVELFATDTTNLARNKNKKVINPWLDRFQNYRLFVKLVEEDGEPEIAFIPHSHSENQKTLMADRCGQPGVWRQLVAGASKSNTLCFKVRYRYTPLN